MSGFGFVLASWAVQLPLVVVLLMGLFYAATNWQKHPNASRYGIWGMVVGLGVVLFDTSLVSLVLDLRSGGGLYLISFVRCCFTALAWGLMLTAAFLGRSGGPEAQNAGRQ